MCSVVSEMETENWQTDGQHTLSYIPSLRALSFNETALNCTHRECEMQSILISPSPFSFCTGTAAFNKGRCCRFWIGIQTGSSFYYKGWSTQEGEHVSWHFFYFCRTDGTVSQGFRAYLFGVGFPRFPVMRNRITRAHTVTPWQALFLVTNLVLYVCPK
jgi:hypothetical protein